MLIEPPQRRDTEYLSETLWHEAALDVPDGPMILFPSTHVRTASDLELNARSGILRNVHKNAPMSVGNHGSNC